MTQDGIYNSIFTYKPHTKFQLSSSSFYSQVLSNGKDNGKHTQVYVHKFLWTVYSSHLPFLEGGVTVLSCIYTQKWFTIRSDLLFPMRREEIVHMISLQTWWNMDAPIWLVKIWKKLRHPCCWNMRHLGRKLPKSRQKKLAIFLDSSIVFSSSLAELLHCCFTVLKMLHTFSNRLTQGFRILNLLRLTPSIFLAVEWRK